MFVRIANRLLSKKTSTKMMGEARRTAWGEACHLPVTVRGRPPARTRQPTALQVMQLRDHPFNLVHMELVRFAPTAGVSHSRFPPRRAWRR